MDLEALDKLKKDCHILNHGPSTQPVSISSWDQVKWMNGTAVIRRKQERHGIEQDPAN